MRHLGSIRRRIPQTRKNRQYLPHHSFPSPNNRSTRQQPFPPTMADSSFHVRHAYIYPATISVSTRIYGMYRIHVYIPRRARTLSTEKSLLRVLKRSCCSLNGSIYADNRAESHFSVAALRSLGCMLCRAGVSGCVHSYGMVLVWCGISNPLYIPYDTVLYVQYTPTLYRQCTSSIHHGYTVHTAHTQASQDGLTQLRGHN
jgi:hypothetical protein